MRTPFIPDHHNPRNEDCEQNRSIESDCTCVKRVRTCSLINRACVRKHLLDETNSRNTRQFTCVRPETLDAIAALVKREIIRRAQDAPRTGKTL